MILQERHLRMLLVIDSAGDIQPDNLLRACVSDKHQAKTLDDLANAELITRRVGGLSATYIRVTPEAKQFIDSWAETHLKPVDFFTGQEVNNA